MTAIVVTQQARQDRDSILDYYGEGTPAADRFIEQVAQAFAHLSQWPDSAGRRRWLPGRNLRGWLIDPHLIVLQREKDRLVVLAILHTSRDIGRELRDRRKSNRT